MHSRTISFLTAVGGLALLLGGCNDSMTGPDGQADEQQSDQAQADLTGRWNGTWGADGIREVLSLTHNGGATFSGSSFFENRRGVALSQGRGTVNGEISGSDVTFTLRRDGLVFHWFGTASSSGTVLRGTFRGYSNDNLRSLATPSSGGKRMKTVLDLIGEFAVLNDAKVMWGGRLPDEAEQRWEELKDFYDLLMSKSGVGPRPVTRQFSAKDIEEKVTSRERLRVPFEMDMIFRADEEFHAAKGVNVSRGGLYLSSPLILPVSTTVTVYLASSDVTHESLLEAPGEVVWANDEGRDRASLPPGMGITALRRKKDSSSAISTRWSSTRWCAISRASMPIAWRRSSS